MQFQNLISSDLFTTRCIVQAGTNSRQNVRCTGLRTTICSNSVKKIAKPKIPLVSVQEFISIAEGIAELFGQPTHDRVFRNHGFSRSLLTRPELMFPNVEYMRFLEACARESSSPLLGVMIGESVPFRSLGPFGAYVTDAWILSEALRRASRGLRYHESGSQFDLVIRDKGSVLIYRPATPNAVGTRHQCDAVAAMLIGLIRLYTGPNWQPQWIGVQAGLGRRQKLLEGHFGVPVRFCVTGVEVPLPASELCATQSTPTDNVTPLTCADLRRLVSLKPPQDLTGALK